MTLDRLSSIAFPKSSPLYIGLFTVISILSITATFFNTYHPNVKTVSQYWAVIITINFLLFLSGFYARYKTFNNPFIYFIATAFICWYGQIFVSTSGLETTTPLIIETFNPRLFHNTLQFSSISFFMLCLIALLFSNKLSYKNFTSKVTNISFRRSMNTVGIFLAVISVYTYFTQKIQSMIISLTYGYGALYDDSIRPEMSSTDNILTNFSMFFVPSIVILIIANKGSSKIRAGLVGVLLVSIIMSFISGGRAEALAIILALFWIYSNEITKINFKKMLVLSLLGLIVVKLVTVTAEFRIVPERSISTFVELMFSGGSDGPNPLVDMIAEFGFNIFSLYHTMILVPATQAFAGGYTYFAAMMAIIPSLFFNGYSFSDAAGLPDWLKDILHMDYGPGYSITAEAYYNFGWVGIIAMAAVGMVLSIMFLNNKVNPDMKSLQNGFIAIVLYSNLFIARDTSLLVFRKYFYTIIIPFVLIFVAYNFYRARERRADHE